MRTHTLFAVVAGTLFVAGCTKEQPVQKAIPPVRATVQSVQTVDEPRVFEAVGSVRSDREAVVAGKVMGTVTEIRKNAGESFSAGEVLVVIDSRDVAGQVQQARGALAQAQAALVIAETNYKRFEQLRAKGASSQLELDQARYQYETAKGAVAQAEGAVATATSYQSNAQIPAPFDGRVVDRMCEAGDMAAPGRPLLKIEDSRRLRLDVSVTEQQLSNLSTGAAVSVIIPSIGDRRFEGRVAEIVPAADPATHSFLVKIRLPEDPVLRAGAYGRALFRGGMRSVIRLPRAAIVLRGGMTGVYAVESGKAVFRIVTISDEGSDAPEVLAGLAAGDTVIVSAADEVVEGAPVEARS